MPDLEERVIAFVVEEAGVERKHVQLASRLAQDLGIDGDDAVHLLKMFGEKFHVDLTDLYDHWNQHFRPEGFWTVGLMDIAVTVQDLVDAAVSRIWVKRYHEPTSELFRTFY
ncbi:MAG: DUF1493 family protein [Bryobacteraceae bacterium]|jgi:acyl carrier protein